MKSGVPSRSANAYMMASQAQSDAAMNKAIMTERREAAHVQSEYVKNQLEMLSLKMDQLAAEMRARMPATVPKP